LSCRDWLSQQMLQSASSARCLINVRNRNFDQFGPVLKDSREASRSLLQDSQAWKILTKRVCVCVCDSCKPRPAN